MDVMISNCENPDILISKQDIKKLFLKLNIELYSTGIKYLIEAILIASRDNSLLQNLQDIYEIIGQEYNVDSKKIKWSIRSSLDTINKYSNSEVFKSVFKYFDDTRALTPKYFIKLVLYYFDMDIYT